MATEDMVEQLPARAEQRLTPRRAETEVVVLETGTSSVQDGLAI